MTRTPCSFRHVVLSLATVLFAAAPALAQTLQPRITTPIDDAARTVLSGSRPARALAANDIGRVPANMPLKGMTLVFRRTAAQQAGLDALIAAQQDPSSPLYHQWLSPDQFAARFGMAASDIAKAQAWLQQQGFSVTGVSRSRDRITFSGTAAQVQSAFGAEIDDYQSGTETRFAPATDISLPSALAATVADVTNLSSFRPRPRVILKPNQTAQPNFTSSQSGSHYLSPKDVATIYDINPAYNAGYTGSNQSIAIVGQSAVLASDIANFQSAAGLTPKSPAFVLVPNSGASTVNPSGTGDEAESDLDLEYAGAIAPGASIFFVYTGSNQNYGVFDSLQYAIDERLAPIISISYGACEAAMSSANFGQLDGLLQQAATQGQSVIAASGDDGSTDCYGETGVSSTLQQTLSVDYPASSQYATGMGGTEFSAADVAIGNNTYFAAQGSTDIIGSALSYIPEQVWNDDSASGGLSSGGGGVSIYSPRPAWQTGVPGITAGSFRLVPDISLDASPNNAGFLFCSSDPETGITGSCSNGFRDVNNVYLTSAGGTSFDAPIFSGMLAIISQKVNATGQGVINPTLYSLASNPATYASVFHDITSGNNECTAGSAICTSAGAGSYSATTGYDEASGLGSFDFYNLMMAWPTTANSALASTTTRLSAATATPASGASDVITITVAPTSSALTATPTGTVSVAVDGSATAATVTLVNGAATYTFSNTTPGAHVVTATYSGDATYAASTAAVAVTVASVGTFTLTATNITVASGSAGTSTVTATPSGGYTGTVDITASTTANLANACYTISPIVVPGTAAVQTSLTIYTSSAACNSAGLVGVNTMRRFRQVGGLAALAIPPRPGPSPSSPAPLGVALAGLVGFGIFRKRSRLLRKLQPLLAIALLAVAGLGLIGCGGNGSSSQNTGTNSNLAKGSYPLTLVGTDANQSAITSTTTITLTVN